MTIRFRYFFGISYLFFIYTIGGDVFWTALTLGIVYGIIDLAQDKGIGK